MSLSQKHGEKDGKCHCHKNMGKKEVNVITQKQCRYRKKTGQKKVRFANVASVVFEWRT